MSLLSEKLARVRASVNKLRDAVMFKKAEAAEIALSDTLDLLSALCASIEALQKEIRNERSSKEKTTDENHRQDAVRVL